VFDMTDALVTKQYLTISSNGDDAIADFFETRYALGVIRAGRDATAMDVDFNQRVMVADVAHMVLVKYNSRRFVLPATQTCDGDGRSVVTTRVERANPHEFALDPANVANTRIYFLITGNTLLGDALATQLLAEGGPSSVDAAGRFRGVLRAEAMNDMPGEFKTSFSTFGEDYGVTVIQFVQKTTGVWELGYVSSGDPLDTIHKIENSQLDLDLDIM